MGMTGRIVTPAVLSCLVVAADGFSVRAQQPAAQSAVEYNAQGELKKPADYREWVFLSSGLGMTYSPPPAAGAAPATPRPPSFTNVFVNPTSYREFMKSGKWPDQTMFILEIRRSASQGSINKGGSYQAEIANIEAEVKDSRLPEGWGYFDFREASAAKPLPTTASCYTCHKVNAAVEHTFVQFYPSLMEVARAHNTVNAGWNPNGESAPQH